MAICTFSKRIDSFTSENELIRTLGESTERCTWPPEMMQPSLTSESVAWPTRFSSTLLKTNLAGGDCGAGAVKMGQRSL